MKTSESRHISLALVLFAAVLLPPALFAQDGAHASRPAQAPGLSAPPERLPEPIAIAHILIAYKGAREAPVDVTRDREAARALAASVLREARAPGADFEALVEKYTDDAATIPIRGRFMTITVKSAPQGFDDVLTAALGLKLGDVSEVVTSPVGFHVLKRIPLVEFCGSHILVRFKGSRDAPVTLTRTREEAYLLAQKILAEVRAAPGEFAALATKHSEGITSKQGGSLGVFEGGNTIREVEAALAEIGVGEITGPVESAWGFHIIKREPIVSMRASHILITYKGAPQSPKAVERGREEAIAFVLLLKAQVESKEATFAEIAKEHSDDPSTAGKGGDVGIVRPGQADQRFADAVMKLKVGEVTSIIETPFGFHIIQRTK